MKLRNIILEKKYTFADGVCVEWLDRESLKYIDGNFSTLIWVDYEPGFFNSGRVIMSSSLDYWHMSEQPNLIPISAAQKKDIINRITEYYRRQGIKCRVEL